MSESPRLLTFVSVALPLVTTSVTVYGLLTAGAGTLWLVGSLAMMAEAAGWAACYRWRSARSRGLRPNVKGVAVLACLAALGAYLVNLARVTAGLLVFFSWLLLVPLIEGNRNRWQAWRRARRAAVVEEVISEAETVGLVARCAVAMKVLRGAPAVEGSPEVALRHAAAMTTGMRFTQGVMHTRPDGSLVFEETPA